MNRDKVKIKLFRKNVLKAQLSTIGEKFKQSALQWLIETKNIINDVSAETKQHPNKLLADLRKINYERAYILYKMDAVDKNMQLPLPMKLRQKMKKTEMEVQFQEEFPDEYQQFTTDLKEKLRKKLHSPSLAAPKTSSTSLEDLNWNISLGAPIKINTSAKPCWFHTPPRKPAKPQKKHSPCIKNILSMLQSHGTRTLQDPTGYYTAPNFTKAKVEKMLGIWMSHSKFTQLKSKLNEKQKRKRLGQVKRDNERRRERRNKQYDFINPL